MKHLNRLYDSLRTEHAWRYTSDNLATGTIISTVNGTVLTNITLTITPSRLLQQWPKAAAVYPLIRFFGIAPATVPTANAGIECLFYDNGGGITPLGEFLGQTGGNINLAVLLNTPILDPSSTAIGQLSVRCSNVANANGTYNYSFGFSLAYLLAVEHETAKTEQHLSRGGLASDRQSSNPSALTMAHGPVNSSQGLASIQDMARRR